ncbi:MAG: serine protease [Isosphaeraceae bacterium]
MRGSSQVFLWIASSIFLLPAPSARAQDPVRATRYLSPARSTPAANHTFRPTVKIRRGLSSGTGTLIAARPGESLILTAAHVVQGDGSVEIELHRYNLGVEANLPGVGWPKSYPGEVVVADPEADVALVRLKGLVALPFLASLVSTDEEPRPGQHVTSVGIDQGMKLQSWESRVRGVVRLNRNGEPDVNARPYLITEKAPEHGRSGGGLFRDDGLLIGVCVGRIEFEGHRAIGLFASTASIRRLLDEPNAAAALRRFPALASASRLNAKASTP